MANNLKKDLPLGQNGEDIVLEFLREKYPDAERILGSHKEYDIHVPSQDLKIEVKTDIRSKDTGNIAIEHESYGKPSGIKVTTADFWAFIYFKESKAPYSQNGWFCGFWPIDDLKKMCESAYSVRGGDDMASQLYLIPVSKAHKIMETWKIPENLLTTILDGR